MNKTKINSFRNFKYAFSKIYQIDKIYIFELMYLTITGTILTFSYPYILTVVISGIENGKEMVNILTQTAIVVIVNFILGFTRDIVFNDMYNVRFNKIGYQLTKEFYLKTFDLDYEKFEDTTVQDELEKASKAIGTYGGLIQILKSSFDVMEKILIFIISSSIILTANGILIIFIFTLSIIIYVLESYRKKKYKTEFRDKITNIHRKITYANNISRNLSIGKDLRIYDMNKFISKVRNQETNKFLRLYKNENKRYVRIELIINIIRSIDEILLYGFMIYEVIYNNMDIALFTFMIASVRELINSLHLITHNNGQVVDQSLRINDYLEFTKIDLTYSNGKIKLEKGPIEVEFKNVYYRYLNQEGYALNNLSFKIKKGESISLVGFNGAGKTTLIKLLCGFYHPTEGTILINGLNIEDIDRKSLLELFAPVFQESEVFAVKVLENISVLHEEDTDLVKVKEAMAIVGLTDKIASLNNQEHTVITKDYDDEGIELSGGENQKINIARCIYKNAPFIILDEPTSALDSIAEAKLYENLNHIIKDASAIFISHRLSSTKFCDRIIVLEEGKIKEMGTHEELIKSQGIYQKMFNMQAEYYVGGTGHEEV